MNAVANASNASVAYDLYSSCSNISWINCKSFEIPKYASFKWSPFSNHSFFINSTS